MRKLFIIAKREYLSRVRKKSFIIMSILGPVLISGVVALSVYLSSREREAHYILVVDTKAPFFRRIIEMGNCGGEAPIPFMRSVQKPLIGMNIPIICYKYGGDMELDSAKKLLDRGAFTSVLYIPENIERSNTALLFFRSQPSLYTMRTIEKTIEKIIEEEKLKVLNADIQSFYSARTEIKLKLKKWEKGEEKTVITQNAMVGLAASILIYILVFMYSAQVMRGVLEEKTSRIVEILITSVKPLTLMMGKIIGIALVGLTQFIIWLLLASVIIVGFLTFYIGSKIDPSTLLQNIQMTPELSQQLARTSRFDLLFFMQNWVGFQINPYIFIMIFAYVFIFGYLMYASLFAAAASIVDSDADVQQFVLPLTIPLVFAYLMIPVIINKPDGAFAVWLSLIPFTSPVALIVRTPLFMEEGRWSGTWDFYAGFVLLLIGFIISTLIAARLYRIGILKYGAKPSYLTVIKWLVKGN